MADVMNTPLESIDRPPDGDSSEPSNKRETATSASPPRRRDQDSRERRDFDRPSNRYYDRSRDRDYKRRLSSSPPPPYRDRRPYSPPYPPFKRSRKDGGYDGRRGSPRAGLDGYGQGGRRFGYDYPGEREMGGRPGYDDGPHGRFRPGRYPGGPTPFNLKH